MCKKTNLNSNHPKVCYCLKTLKKKRKKKVCVTFLSPLKNISGKGGRQGKFIYRCFSSDQAMLSTTRVF